MIRTVFLPNLFEPHKRVPSVSPWHAGDELQDSLPPGVSFGAPNVAVWLNGKLALNPHAALNDGDSIHVGVAPAGIEWIAVVKWIVVALFAAGITKILTKMDDVPQAEDAPDANYSYYGFQNQYTPIGAAIPVIYGTMRTAAPCINQSVTGALPVGGGGLVNSDREWFNALYAISEGPIRGMGQFLGTVSNDSEQTALVGGSPYNSNIAGGLLLQLNGIDGATVNADMMWRTGEVNQDPIIGLDGFIEYTDAGVVYAIRKEIPDGIAPSLPNGDHVAYASRLIDPQAEDFVHQALSQKADRALVQFLFKRGLWEEDVDSGDFLDRTAILRIQYWKTDAAGTATSDVIILPQFEVTNDSPNPFSVDIPFTLFDPSGDYTYAASVQNNWAAVSNGSATTGGDSTNGTGTLRNSNESALEDLRPYGEDLTIFARKFSFACWIMAQDMRNNDHAAPSNWIWFWGKSFSGDDLYEHGHERFYTPPTGNNDYTRRGCAANLVCDQGGSVGPAGLVYLRLFAWEGQDAITGANNASTSWWLSEPLGTAAEWAPDPASGPPGSLDPPQYPIGGHWHHIGITYDETNLDLTPGGGPGQATLRLYINGVQKAMNLAPIGGVPGTGNPGNFPSGWLYSNAVPDYRHVPVRFRVTSDTYFQIGRWDNEVGQTNRDRKTELYVSEFLFYEGILPPSWYSNAYNQVGNYGNRTFSIASMRGNQSVHAAYPLNGLTGAYTYENFGHPTGTTVGTGALQVVDSSSNPSSSCAIATDRDEDGPSWTGESGTAVNGYYVIEAFKNRPSYDSEDEAPGGPRVQDTVSVDSITSWSSQNYQYPSVATLSARIEAQDQVNNSTPTLTTIVHGRTVKVYNSSGSSSIEWSNNPAWVALDLLTNRRYGMGTIFSPNGTEENIDIESFREWAAYCDEGTPDAFGDVDFFGIGIGTAATMHAEIGAFTQLVVAYVGLVDDAGAQQQTLPISWVAPAHSGSQVQPTTILPFPDPHYVSFTEITADGITADYVTSEDVLGGTNNASSLLRIVYVETITDTDGFHGWNTYAKVYFEWNRWPTGTGSQNYPPGPPNFESDHVFADSYAGLTSFGKLAGYEHRFRCDIVLAQNNQNGWDTLLNIFATGRAMPVKAGKTIMAIADRPRDPVALMGQASIVAGSFELSYTSPEVEPNSLEAEILDRDHNYERRTVLVDHASIQDGATTFAQLRKKRLALPGITRRSQAIRECTYRLNSANLLRRSLQFEVGPDAIHLLPGDRILVSHDVPQYGYSGRFAADATMVNIHPGASGIYPSINFYGGNCAMTHLSLIEENATAPPVTGYTTGSTFGYSLPTASSGGVNYPAGELGHNGYNKTITWASQYVATDSALYPNGSNSGPFNTLDQILSLTVKKELSVYVKEPTLGAATGLALNIYRYRDETGASVNDSTTAKFKWVDDGGVSTLQTDTTDTGLTSIVDNAGSGWWRATIIYDPAAVSPTPDIGDYIQGRIYYGYSGPSPSNALWRATLDAPDTGAPDETTGRNSNIAFFADPLNLDGVATGTDPWWQFVNRTYENNVMAHDTAVAPPFYPNDTGANAGRRGYVVRMDYRTTDTGTLPPQIYQQVGKSLQSGGVVGQLPSMWPGDGASGVGKMDDQRITVTLYAKLAATSTSTNPSLRVTLAEASGAASPNLNGAGYLDPDPGVEWFITGWTSGSFSVATYVDGGWVEESNSAAYIRQTTLTTDSDWVEISLVAYSPSDYGFLSVGVHPFATSAGIGAFDVWGIRVHGESGRGYPDSVGEGTFVNTNAHRGQLMWGPMYNAAYAGDGSTATAWTEGGTVQLDQDVTLDAGESYEVYARSSSHLSPDARTDAQEVVSIAESEVPASGSTVIPARTSIDTKGFVQFLPGGGDLYSFGKTAAATEDFAIVSIETDATSLGRKISCTEYVEAVYDDTAWGTLGDATISDLPPPGVQNSAQWGFGDDLVSMEGGVTLPFKVTATAAPFRSANAGAVPSIRISWQGSTRRMPYKEVRLFCSRVTATGVESTPRFVATLPSGVNGYRYDDAYLSGRSRFRFRVQRVGWSGTSEPLMSSPYAEVEPVVIPALPVAPSVTVALSGFEQMYSVDASELARVESIEGRVGGWCISTPGFVVSPEVGRAASEAILVGTTNSAGDTNAAVVCRAKLATGNYGIATIVTPAASEQFVDVRTSSGKIAEDDFAGTGTVPSELEVSSGVLQWNFSTPSSALKDIYYPMAEIDLTTATKAVATAFIEGFQVRPEAMEDLPYALGSEKLKNWSLEGPMLDDGLNSTVKIEWRWTSGASLSGVDYRPFEPGEVYLRKAQFRLAWTRQTTTSQAKVTRFQAKLYVPTPDPVDGGDFS